MKGTIRVDHLNKNILISKTFARASMRTDSDEYKTLSSVKAIYPEYEIHHREIRKNPQKESYRGLTYTFMEYYILTHDSERMAEYQEMRLRARCHTIRYAHIKKWFLEMYPEIDDFSSKKKGGNEIQIAA